MCQTYMYLPKELVVPGEAEPVRDTGHTISQLLDPKTPKGASSSHQVCLESIYLHTKLWTEKENISFELDEI